MAAIILPHRRVRQPPWGTPLKDEFAQRMRFLAYGNSPNEVVTRASFIVGSATQRTDAAGPSWRFPGLANQSVGLSDPKLPTDSDRTLLVQFKARTDGVPFARGIISENIGGYFGGLIRQESTGAVAFYIGAAGSQFGFVTSSSGVLQPNIVYTAVGIRRGSGIEIYFKDLMPAASTWATATVDQVTGYNLGVSSHNSGQAFTGEIFIGASMRGAISPIQAQELAENPWQIFESKKRRLYFQMPALAPILSGATAINLGPTSMRPRVTITI